MRIASPPRRTVQKLDFLKHEVGGEGPCEDWAGEGWALGGRELQDCTWELRPSAEDPLLVETAFLVPRETS